MEAQGGGAIVTVASNASVGAGAAGVAYTTSKHAVIGLVKNIAYFYGPKGIRSNAVLPGAVATGIGASSAPRVPWAMDRAMLPMATMPSTPAEPACSRVPRRPCEPPGPAPDVASGRSRAAVHASAHG
jgi:NAD(P)-dependent dehydrogenase (short-subunit alcohol dehydrogenase family)